MTKLVASREIAQDVLEAWHAGAKEFNDGKYWEAHESWEHGWKNLPEPIKSDVQAHIQACGVLVHFQKGNSDPATRLCEAALSKLSDEKWAPRLVILGLPDFLRVFLKTPSKDLNSWLTKARKLEAQVE
jgi:predicted metal-dependent hydrolase